LILFNSGQKLIRNLKSFSRGTKPRTATVTVSDYVLEDAALTTKQLRPPRFDKKALTVFSDVECFRDGVALETPKSLRDS